MSLELRWFFEGPLPDEISEWCLKKGFLKERTRTDTYLLFPSSDLGVKLRDGKLQIKYLISAEEFHSEDHEISGKMETWRKSSLPLKDPSTNPFQDVEGPQIAVEKERDSRRYEVDPTKGIVTPSDKRVAQGIMIEVTKLTIEGIQWWTLAFDALGEKQKECLQLGVTSVLKDYPGPKPQKEKSFSYPKWLSIIYDEKQKRSKIP